MPRRRSPEPARAVLVNVDGTFVDSNYQHALAWHRAFAQHGRPVPAWRTHRAIGMVADQLVPALAGEDWAAEHGDAVRATESALFGEMIGTVAPLPGARAFLELLALRGHAVVLSSSASADDLEHYADLLGARDLVETWTTSADVERTKPEPDLVLAAVEKLGDLAEAVMIGDSVYVEAAWRAGLPAHRATHGRVRRRRACGGRRAARTRRPAGADRSDDASPLG